LQRIDQAGTFDSDEVLIRTSKVKLSTHPSNRTMTLPGDGNKILAVFEADDFSHGLGLKLPNGLPPPRWPPLARGIIAGRMSGSNGYE